MIIGYITISALQNVSRKAPRLWPFRNSQFIFSNEINSHRRVGWFLGTDCVTGRSCVWFVCWFGLLVWFVGLLVWFVGLLVWFVGFVCWFGLLVSLVGLVCWFVRLVG